MKQYYVTRRCGHFGIAPRNRWPCFNTTRRCAHGRSTFLYRRSWFLIEMFRLVLWKVSRVGSLCKASRIVAGTKLCCCSFTSGISNCQLCGTNRSPNEHPLLIVSLFVWDTAHHRAVFVVRLFVSKLRSQSLRCETRSRTCSCDLCCRLLLFAMQFLGMCPRQMRPPLT